MITKLNRLKPCIKDLCKTHTKSYVHEIFLSTKTIIRPLLQKEQDYSSTLILSKLGDMRKIILGGKFIPRDLLH